MSLVYGAGGITTALAVVGTCKILFGAHPGGMEH